MKSGRGNPVEGKEILRPDWIGTQNDRRGEVGTQNDRVGERSGLRMTEECGSGLRMTGEETGENASDGVAPSRMSPS